MRLAFAYRLTGVGWAEADIACGESRAMLTASYLRDALGDLLRAVGEVAHRGGVVRCSWEEEPGEFRWVFTIVAPGQVQLRILWFDDMYTFGEPYDPADVPPLPSAIAQWVGTRPVYELKECVEPDSAGRTEFECRVLMGDLVRAIAAGADAVLQQWGADGYADRWAGEPFPLEELISLKRWLTSGGCSASE